MWAMRKKRNRRLLWIILGMPTVCRRGDHVPFSVFKTDIILKRAYILSWRLSQAKYSKKTNIFRSNIVYFFGFTLILHVMKTSCISALSIKLIYDMLKIFLLSIYMCMRYIARSLPNKILHPYWNYFIGKLFHFIGNVIY
jgi:hypothetical protein